MGRPYRPWVLGGPGLPRPLAWAAMGRAFSAWVFVGLGLGGAAVWFEMDGYGAALQALGLRGLGLPRPLAWAAMGRAFSAWSLCRRGFVWGCVLLLCCGPFSLGFALAKTKIGCPENFFGQPI
jgi:hypothetical protein